MMEVRVGQLPFARFLERIRKNIVARHSQRRMQVVEHLSLSGKRSLTVVSIDGREFLVGGGSDSVSTIIALTHREGSS